MTKGERLSDQEQMLAAMQLDLKKLLNPNVPDKKKINISAKTGRILTEQFMQLDNRFTGSFFLLGFLIVTDPRLFPDKSKHPYARTSKREAAYAEYVNRIRDQGGKGSEILIKLIEQSKRARICDSANTS